MTARRQLRTKPEYGGLASISPDEDYQLGGTGLDWDTVPDVLDERGQAEWERLSHVFAEQPTRFRESDRTAVVAYCSWWSLFHRAATDVRERGPITAGTTGALVKNPSVQQQRESSQQLRYWTRELAMTPDSRGRAGITEAPDLDDSMNPFSGSA